MISCFRFCNKAHMLGIISKQLLKDTVTMPRLILSNTAKVIPRRYMYHSMKALEDSLPRLPVPSLQQTMDKYLQAVKPLVDEDDYKNTKTLVEEFRKPGGVGEKLQERLLERAKFTDNWLAQWWDDKGYLEQRVPLVVYFSPAATFPKENFTESLSYLKYTARLISNALKFKEEIDSETISVDMAGKDPLSMVQYKLLFGGTRKPHASKDEFVLAPIEKSRHIIVAHRNQFYSMEVYYPNGKPLNEGDLMAQLMVIVRNNDPLEEPVGVLGTTDRTTWAHERKTLEKDKINRSSLDIIDSGLFVICLDKPPVPSTQAPSIMEDATHSISARQCLHGDGVESNSLNRWVDKTNNFCISEDGHVGCLYEHTPAEGPTIARVWEYTVANRHGYESISPSNSISHLTPPIKLKWKIRSSTKEAIKKAKYQLESLVRDLDVRCFKFDHYGKDFIKKHKLSPDAWIQISFQLTHYRLHGQLGPAYETGATRKFKLGRTETIRSASVPTLEFVQSMANPSCSNAERLSFMRAAINAHTTYTKEAINGQGIDRHLLGLKLIALESGMNVPELFMDSTYAYSLHFKISTSQVPFKEETYLLFGPAVPDGYGICYNPGLKKLMFGVTTYNSNPTTNSGHFASCLQRSLDDMQLLVSKSKL
ncbi:carnitine O-acetyltransferase-like [Actinia tenebrosa]|uniref:Carnitine O-acetyltransferase-like n=1 Tax=Actinia tenebrosa TaxID=6105 RepID=A0A6P8HKE6_ACTTE|nr:carnitine O-acetyltransferase-like [Actinia tenebrosa]